MLMRIFFMYEKRCHARSMADTSTKLPPAQASSSQVVCHSAAPTFSGRPLTSSGSSGSTLRITSQPMVPTTAVFRIDFTSSTRLSIENMRFRPLAGFMFSILGLSFSVLITGPAWMNSTSAPTSATGTTTSPTTSSSVMPAWRPRRGAASSNGSCITSKLARTSAAICSPSSGSATAASIRMTSMPAVEVMSLLLAMSPFLRASCSFLGVGFSVLSPLSLEPDMGCACSV